MNEGVYSSMAAILAACDFAGFTRMIDLSAFLETVLNLNHNTDTL